MAIEVNEQNFEAEVIEASHRLPVVVDFWAEWCGPCRVLGPVLEQAARDREGRLVLAKLDTDANPRLAARYGIQGIPAVKAFRGGKVVDEFIGAQPPAVVESFLESLLPSPAEDLVRAGDEDSLRKALELEPGRTDAAVALARPLHARGDDDEAASVLDRVSGSFEADGLAAHIELERDGSPELSEGLSMIDRGEPQAGIEALLSALEQNGAAGGPVDADKVRRVIVGLLTEIGQETEAARRYRRRLSAALH